MEVIANQTASRIAISRQQYIIYGCVGAHAVERGNFSGRPEEAGFRESWDLADFRSGELLGARVPEDNAGLVERLTT